MRVRGSNEPQQVLGFLGVLVLGVIGSGLLYNSEEHKLLADRGASLVDQRSAVLPPLTRFEVMSADQVVLAYKEAKDLAVGFSSNNNAEYNKYEHGVQDNAYWDRYGQLEYNKKIFIPSASQVSFRTLRVSAWTDREHVFTFGELVSLYGDYRRTVHCSQGRCYLTNRDSPQYIVQSGTRAAGTTYFEYGEDCFGVWPFEDCGYEPAPRLTGNYLRYVGSGLVPPFGGWGNAVSNTAWPSEELDAGWWGDEMIRIANVNDWHFSSAAIAWYIGMHRLALLYVQLARTDNRYWNHALHYEANALHSLTDLFAFGHVVTNRDRTSYGIMSDEGLAEYQSYRWMENVIAMGGGRRTLDRLNGRVELNTGLPVPISDLPTQRADFMESDRDLWTARANNERMYHDRFNNFGATVINLKRQEFNIRGDGWVGGANGATERIIAEAVRASVQSLFDAYGRAGSIEEIGRPGSDYFDALLNVPVYVRSHPEHMFDKQWTRYAKMVDAMVNGGLVPANGCVMPYVDGEFGPPASPQGSCDFAPPPAGTLVLEELLSANGALPRADRVSLDGQGNGNNGYDVGDFLAWVRATGATPGNLRTTRVVAPPVSRR